MSDNYEDNMSIAGRLDELRENPEDLIIILGPTASGKTAVSLELDRYFDIEVISADSRQIYKYLDIGTAKPSQEELSKVKHHFIDVLEPDETYSAGMFGEEAEDLVYDILNMHKMPIVVGGSGLYIEALCEGMFDEDEPENKIQVRQALEEELESEGIDKLYSKLEKIDPKSAEKYSDRNPRRILRALEYYKHTGEPLSEAHERKHVTRNFRNFYYGIDYPREELYERINKRAEEMWNSGLIDETKKILEMGYSPQLNSLNTVGYKEAIAYINGEMTEEEALEKMKQSTRRYAKRQITWFKRYDDVLWLNGSPKEMAQKIYENYEERK